MDLIIGIHATELLRSKGMSASSFYVGKHCETCKVFPWTFLGARCQAMVQ